MAANISLITAAILAMRANSSPSPSYSLDFTSTLPSQVTFSRTGSRTAIVAGQVTTVTTGVPAIESWDGINRGLALEPASSNLILQSNSFSTTWTAEQSTVASGVPGPDGNATSAWSVAEDTSTNYHGLRQTVNSFTSGTTTCVSAFFAQKSGATRWGAAIRQAVDFSTVGARAQFLLNGNLGAFTYTDSNYTGQPTCGVQKLANGWYRAWVTAVNGVTGNKRFGPRAINQDFNGNQESYPGSTSEGFRVYGFQVENGVTKPTSYKATTTASAGSGGETAIITDISFLDVTQGTFVIEHNITSGVLLGSGANTVISGTTALPNGVVVSKTAFAWNGTTSDLVNNGGPTVGGGLPSFGADLRLLGTSGVQNVGHIRKITYYPQRLTVAQMQALTAKTSTASVGAWRVASERNKLPNAVVALTGTTPKFLTRVTVKIGSGDVSKLRLDFCNAWGADSPLGTSTDGKTNTGNSVFVDKVSLERVTGVSEIVPVTFSGGRTLTLTNGAMNITCDDILPSSFTGITKFTVGDVYMLKVEGHLASAGNLPVGRWQQETNAQSLTFDGAVTTYSSTDVVGAYTFVSGTVAATQSKCFAPVVIGQYVTGDPATVLYPADSLGEGVGTLTNGTWVVKSTQNLHLSCLESTKGGQGIKMLSCNTLVQAYMQYARVMVVEYGTNNQNSMMDYAQAYAIARANGIGLIAQCSLLCNTTSTDSFVTETNQTAVRAYPALPEQVGIAMSTLGWIDSYYKLVSERGTNQDKWLVNGTAGYATGDGTHPTVVGDDLMASEYQPILSALVATLV